MAARSKQQVRIISGELKGFRLSYPPGREIRPSMQQTKAAVFDSIGASLRDTVFLDLFAAAGGVGIEAISRGAAFVHFVENNSTAVKLLKENIARCGLGEDRTQVHVTGVLDFLADPTNREINPDFIYADPPYESEDSAALLAIIDSMRYPRTRLIMLEHRKNLVIQGSLTLVRTKVKKFGLTWVSFFVPAGGDQ
jgi:16S rRNA (guanine(966)-N(2))-methyltransferase RsmD